MRLSRYASRATASPTNTALPPAASIFSFAEPEKVVRGDRQRARQFARAEDLQATLQLFHDAELLQRVEIERIAFEAHSGGRD